MLCSVTMTTDDMQRSSPQEAHFFMKDKEFISVQLNVSKNKNKKHKNIFEATEQFVLLQVLNLHASFRLANKN